MKKINKKQKSKPRSNRGKIDSRSTPRKKAASRKKSASRNKSSLRGKLKMQTIIIVTVICVVIIGGLVALASTSDTIRGMLGRVVGKSMGQEDPQAIYNQRNVIALWNLDEEQGTVAHNNQGSCGASCNGNLQNFANTSGRDVTLDSGWTYTRRFWGEGALMLDGQNDVLHVPDNAQLTIPDVVIVETWISPREVRGDEDVFSWSHGGRSIQLAVRGTDKKLVAQVTSGSGTQTIQTVGSFADFTNGWKQVNVVNFHGTPMIFIDGASVPTENATTLQNPATSGLRWGTFFGIVDSLSIYRLPSSIPGDEESQEEAISIIITISFQIGFQNYNGPGGPGAPNGPGGSDYQRTDSTSGGGKIPLGYIGKGDDAASNCPGVTRDENEYKGWYSGLDAETDRAYLVTSPDGITWTKEDNTTPQKSDSTSSAGRIPLGTNGRQDDTEVNCGSLVKMRDKSRFEGWYTGDDGGHRRIFLATSPDAKTWTKQGMALDLGEEETLDDTDVVSPGIIRDRRVVCAGLVSGTFFIASKYPPDEVETSYHMWYGGNDGGIFRILHALSLDGSSWTKTGMSVDVGAEGELDDAEISEPTVVLEINKVPVEECCVEVNRIYHMWYGGNDGGFWRIFYATSPDGQTWTKHGVVLDLGANGSGDDAGVSEPTVVLEKVDSSCVTVQRKFHMWYGGNNGDVVRTFYATSPDGIHWTKIDNSDK